METALKVGDRVLFGRSHGEQTMGTALKVNRASVLVRQDEARGTIRDYAVGTKWKVPRYLVRKVEGGTATPVVEAPKPKRPQAEIMQEILGGYSSLSPENLTCDGELRGTAVTRRAANIRSRLNGLFVELGRKISEGEAYGWYDGQNKAY